MQLATSKILVQLSDQERSVVERELREFNQQLLQLQQQLQQSGNHIKQLHHQRDQIMKQRNSANVLQSIHISLQEQQYLQSQLQLQIVELEQQKQGIVNRMKAACRTQHAYESIHTKEEHRLQRQQDLHQQRELDDLVGSRHATRAANGGV
ncbi:MAG: hypothetical protein R8K50_01380 [Mariprofundus sp.]